MKIPAFSNFHRLFLTARWKSLMVLFVGVLAAALHGFILPYRTVYFTEVNEAFSAWLTTRNLSDTALKVAVEETTYRDVAGVAYIYFWLGVSAFFCSFIMIAVWETACLKTVNELRLKFLSHALRMDLKWHEGLGKTNNLNARLTDDILKVKNNLGTKAALLISSITNFVTVVGVCLYMNLKLGGLILLGVCLISGCLVVAGKITTKLAALEQSVQRELGYVAHEVLTSIKIVKSFGCQAFELARFSRGARAGKLTANRKFFVASIHAGTSTFLNYIVYAAGIAYGACLLSNGEISPGRYINTLVCLTMGSFAFASFVPIMSDVAEGASSCGNLLGIFDAIPDVDQESSHGSVVDHLQGDIIFKDVEFAYPSRKDWKVLDRLNMTIPQGKTVAIVGPSGAGKSSVINLILRLFEPEAGQISLDGRNIREIAIGALRSKIGLVAQEPILFDGSIEENIRLGNLNATPDEIRQAAKQAHAHEFISALPQGYSTIVGERGGKLSGGQIQRIAVARALARNPDIFLFDEATSALDSRNEKLVHRSIENVCRGKTTVIVTHRLSTIRQADVIFVMKGGRVAEVGKHDELTRLKGLYYSLYEEQKALEEEHGEQSELKYENPSGECATNNDSKDEHDKFNIREDIKSPPLETLQSILHLSRKELVLAAILFSILTGFTVPLFTSQFYLQFNIDAMFLTVPAKEFYSISWNIVFFSIAAGLVLFLGIMAASYSMEIAVENLKTRMFRSVISQDLCFFERATSSPMKVANAILGNPGQVRDVGGAKASSALNGFTFLLIGAIMALVNFWRLSLILVGFVLVLVTTNYYQTRLRFFMQRENNVCESDASKLVSMCFDNITAVYCFSLQKYMVKKYEEIVSARASREWKEILMYATAFGLSNSVSYFYVTASYTLGTKWVYEGEASLSGLIVASYILQVALRSVDGVVMYFQELGRAKPAIDEAVSLMNLKSAENASLAPGSKLDISGAIILRNLAFSYPSCSSFVLNGLNLDIKPGQTVAIVGQSGSGKTTIINLLQKFYFPSWGEILIDGVDIRELDTDQLRNSMGLVTQQPLLLSGTIRDNILYGVRSLSHSVTESDMVNCCRQANIHEFINSLPQGYDTEVGSRGSHLSGGQKQRISIARALIRDPRVLLLDEATSALDAESEKEVQKALNVARKGRTTIVVAHKLSTIQNADVIAVMDKGVIVEIGSHEELLDLRGVYYRMTRQF